MNPKNIDRFTKLITKYPISFVAAVFFCMFWVTYFINIRKNEDAEEVWKELYLKERSEKDKLKNQLLIKAGIIEKQNEIIKNTSDTLRNSTETEVRELLKSK